MADGIFDLVFIGQQVDGGRVWPVVELAMEMSLGRSIVIVSSDNADAHFHRRARDNGAVVLSAPARVRAPASAADDPLIPHTIADAR
jgi:hypothetical protein